MSEITRNKKKVAVVLFNLGGPDSLNAIKPFLFNLFNDKYIITLPSVLRFVVAKLISIRREKFAKTIYANTGGKSPILEETLSQKKALKEELIKNSDITFELFICMRHWHPMTEEVVKNIKNYDHKIFIFRLISYHIFFYDNKKISSVRTIFTFHFWTFFLSIFKKFKYFSFF